MVNTPHRAPQADRPFQTNPTIPCSKLHGGWGDLQGPNLEVMAQVGLVPPGQGGNVRLQTFARLCESATERAALRESLTLRVIRESREHASDY